MWLKANRYFELQKAGGAIEIPEEISLNHPLEMVWELWCTLEAIDWKWPPSVILGEDEAIMSDLLTVASYAGKVRRIKGG